MSIRHRPPASATAHHRPATRPSTRNVGRVSPFRPMTIERARASSTLVRSVWESDAIPIVRPSRRGRRWPHRRSGRGLVAPPPGPSTRHAGADPPGPVCNLGPIRSRDRRSGRQGSHRAQRRQGVPKRGRVKYSPPQRLASTVGGLADSSATQEDRHCPSEPFEPPGSRSGPARRGRRRPARARPGRRTTTSRRCPTSGARRSSSSSCAASARRCSSPRTASSLPGMASREGRDPASSRSGSTRSATFASSSAAGCPAASWCGPRAGPRP